VSEKPWTEAHQREMRIAFRRLADHLDLDGNAYCAGLLTSGAARGADETESRARGLLSVVSVEGDEADAILRRVRALAERRLVRETGERYGIRFPEGAPAPRLTWEGAKCDAKKWRDSGSPHVRAVRIHVTRIRRARP
jgi:hypothetical protein